MLGVYWTLGGSGFPFGPGTDSAAGTLAGSALSGLQRDAGAPLIAGIGLLGAGIAALLSRNDLASRPKQERPQQKLLLPERRVRYRGATVADHRSNIEAFHSHGNASGE
jgi:hypothetical protein